MNPQDLLQEGRMNLGNLSIYLGPGFDAHQRELANVQGLRLFQFFGVIPTRVTPKICEQCNLNMRSVTDRHRGIGWRYRCPNGHKYDPTYNTVLTNNRLHEVGTDPILKLMYCWIKGWNLGSALEEVNISNHTGVTWYRYFRDVAEKIAWHDFQRLGGNTDIVEVDETHLFKRKYNRGRITMWQHIWLFGGISRTTKSVFGQVVENRSRNTLLPIMQDCIDELTTIISDEWRAYQQCDEAFAGHETVNHSIEFIRPGRHLDPEWVPAGRYNAECLDKQWIGAAPLPGVDPVRYHTQNCERSWRELKKYLSGCNQLPMAKSYVGEWMYRTNILNKIPDRSAKMARFLQDIYSSFK